MKNSSELLIRKGPLALAWLSSLILCGSMTLVGADLPKVHILATGGTISGKAPERIQLSGYKSGSFGIEEMLAGVPEINEIAEVSYEQVSNIGSGGINTEILLTLARKIHETYSQRPDVSGIIVTHGTGTMEETAYFLNLTSISDKPVVCVGAMRPWSAVSGDGPLNLYNAVRVAIHPESRGKGTLISMDDQIYAGREGTKTDTYRVETFSAREFGLLGYADPDKVVYYRSPLFRHTYQSEFNVLEAEDLPQVDIIYGGYQEASPGAVLGLIEAGVDGIVFASGSSGFTEAIEKAREKGIAIVYSDRKGQGRVLNSSKRMESGIVTADNLRPQKARILLRLALTKTSDPEELQRIFNQY